jgi:hypothetical protein
MKRALLALAILLALLVPMLSAALFVHVVSANPFMPSGSWSDEPVPPSISIQSPIESLNYWSGSDVWLNFTVAEPLTNWYSAGSISYPDYYATTLGNLTQVSFSIDGKQENIVSKISESPLKSYKIYNPMGGLLHFSVNLGRLPVGQHRISITADGSAYYGNLTHSAFSDSFPIDTDKSDKTKFLSSSLQRNFAVDDVATITFTEPFPTVTIATVSVVSVVIVGAGLMVYFKRRKGKP